MSLKGSLETVGVAEILQFLAGTGKTGEFRLAGDGGGGRVWFDSGFISGFEAGSSATPSEAIFELLRLDRGDFEFDAGAERPSSFGQLDDGDLSRALDQAERRMTEWRGIVETVPSQAHRVHLETGLPAGDVTLTAAQWSMVAAIGSGRVISELITDRGPSEFEVCRVLKELLDADLAGIEEPVSDETWAHEDAADEDTAHEGAGDEGAGAPETDAEQTAVITHIGPPVDALGDRGPWTSSELAEIALLHEAEPAGAEATGTEPAGTEPAGAAADEAGEDDEPESEQPAEQPINRSLLLKFLSSVHD